MKKYRVIIRGSYGSVCRNYPYRSQTGIEKKFLFFKWTTWEDLDIHQTLAQAKSKILEESRRPVVEVLTVGEIVYEYDDSDHIADKLKGKA